MFCSGYTALPFFHSQYKQHSKYVFCGCYTFTGYQLLENFFFSTVLSKKLSDAYSIQQYFHIKFSFKSLNKSVNKRYFLKISNLYRCTPKTLPLWFYICTYSPFKIWVRRDFPFSNGPS